MGLFGIKYKIPFVLPYILKGYTEVKGTLAKASSTRIRIFLNPQLFLSGHENIRVHMLCDHSVFVSNSPVHTYSDSLRIH